MPGSIKTRVKQFKEEAHALAHDRPGQRFENHYTRSQKNLREHPVKKISVYVIALLLIGSGFLFGFVPGAPGLFLGIPGLALIAARSRYFARFLDQGEMAIRKLILKVMK